ncbi:MAG: hypothetical protein WKG07_38055 [Hymenobacter sp.]
MDFKPGAAHQLSARPAARTHRPGMDRGRPVRPFRQHLAAAIGRGQSPPGPHPATGSVLASPGARRARPGGSEWLVPFVIAELQRPAGPRGVEDLARRAGYSRRYLARCFAAQVGVGPKTLASILRFQRFCTRPGRGAALPGLVRALPRPGAFY